MNPCPNPALDTGVSQQTSEVTLAVIAEDARINDALAVSLLEQLFVTRLQGRDGAAPISAEVELQSSIGSYFHFHTTKALHSIARARATEQHAFIQRILGVD